MGDRHDDQGDEEPGAVASPTDDATGRDAGGHARVPPRQVRGGAACGGVGFRITRAWLSRPPWP
jgi:hypothetical protein